MRRAISSPAECWSTAPPQHRHRPRFVGNALGMRTTSSFRHQSQERKTRCARWGSTWSGPGGPYKNPNNYVKVSGRIAERLARSEPEGAIWDHQLDNIATARRARATTGPKSGSRPGQVDGFICAVGTAGRSPESPKRSGTASRTSSSGRRPLWARRSLVTTARRGLESSGHSITRGHRPRADPANLEGLVESTCRSRSPTRKRSRAGFDLLEHEGLGLGPRRASTSPARSASPGIWGPATPSSPSSPTMATRSSRSSTTPNSALERAAGARLAGTHAIHPVRFRRPAKARRDAQA